MAIVSMTPAVAGNVALAAEYNKLITNITDLDTRTTAVEAAVGGGTGEIPRKGGEFVFPAAGTLAVPIGTKLIDNWVANGSISGISVASGVFTVSEGGLWHIDTSVRLAGGNSTSTRYLIICGTSLTDTWYKNSTGAALNIAVSGTKRLTAGATFRIYCYIDGAAGTLQRESSSDLLPVVSAFKIGN
jgi:hypothetical protein